jgi:phage-related minor tail protein
MNRPLQYSTPQRVEQYNTVKSAGLSRPDYRDAIKRLNKAEMKYRTAQKLKNKKEAQRDAERQAQAQATAVARANARLEAEKKKKADKNKKRREKNALDKANRKIDAEKAKQRSFIKDLISNMRNRIGATYDFKDARAIGLSPQEIVKTIAEYAGNEPWVFSLDNGTRTISNERDRDGNIIGQGQYYTLSDSNKVGLFKLLVIQYQFYCTKFVCY